MVETELRRVCEQRRSPALVVVAFGDLSIAAAFSTTPQPGTGGVVRSAVWQGSR
jgi:hypothetical protein